MLDCGGSRGEGSAPTACCQPECQSCHRACATACSRFSIQSLVHSALRGSTPAKCRRAAGLWEHLLSLQRAWRVTTTREHRRLRIDEPNARCPDADCSSRQGDHARSKCVSRTRLLGCERTADSFLCCQIIKRLSNLCGLSAARCFALSELVSEQSLSARCAVAVAVSSVQGRSFRARPTSNRTLLCMRAPAGSARIDAHGRSSTCSSLTHSSIAQEALPSAQQQALMQPLPHATV